MPCGISTPTLEGEITGVRAMSLVARFHQQGRRGARPDRSPETPILDAMPQAIDAAELKSLVDKGAQLIEVLPPREYEEEHLPGAINLPLKSFTPDNLSQLDRRRPVIVYCWDDD